MPSFFDFKSSGCNQVQLHQKIGLGTGFGLITLPGRGRKLRSLVTTQSEYSTDIQFKSREDLCELYPHLLSHSTLCFGAQEVMNFLGRKLNGNFQGEVVSELSSFVCRRTGGSKIKHRVQENWLKMYDKAGLVLRVETVINNPEEFRARKRVTRKGKRQMEWVDMRKGVARLFRYRLNLVNLGSGPEDSVFLPPDVLRSSCI